MNKLFCFLSGGHKYSDKDMICTDYCIKRQFVLMNKCTKCGEIVEFLISYDTVYGKWIENGLWSSDLKD